MKIITRAEARAQGLTRYFTGEPCPKGHTAERNTVGKNCIECGRVIASLRRGKTDTSRTNGGKTRPEYLTKKEAFALGLTRYFNGIPCPQGHVAERYLAGGCLTCFRLRQVKYQKDYRQKNKNKIGASLKKRADKINAWRRIYYQTNREKELRRMATRRFKIKNSVVTA